MAASSLLLLREGSSDQQQGVMRQLVRDSECQVPPSPAESEAAFFFLLASPTRDQTHSSCSGMQNLNHWAAREAPIRSWILTRPADDAGVH